MADPAKTYGEFWDYSFRSHYRRGLAFRRPQDAETPSLKAFLDWQRTPPPPARVLDAGCGDGRNAVFLAALGYEVTGIDASSVAVERAQTYADEQRVTVRFLRGDIRAMSCFPDATLAMAIDNKTFHALWTYEDRAAYLRELARVQRPGAALFFRQCCTPAELRDEFGWTEFLGKPIRPDAQPEDFDREPDSPGIWPNSMRKYERQLQRAGFSMAKAAFYKDDPEPVSVLWAVRI